MDQNYKNDFHLFYLRKEDNDSSADFQVNFIQPISFDRPMELALVEINLPNYMSTSTKSMDYYLDVWVYLMDAEKIADVKIEGEDEKFIFYGELRKKHFKLDSLPQNISLIEKMFQNFCKEADKFALWVFKQKYPINLNNLDPNLNAIKKIDFKYDKDIGKFSSGLGEIYVQHNKTLLIPGAKYGFTFSQDLHKMLGFDISKWPRIRQIFTNIRDTYDEVALNPPLYTDQQLEKIQIVQNNKYKIFINLKFFDTSNYEIPGEKKHFTTRGGETVVKKSWIFPDEEFSNETLKQYLENTIMNEANIWAKTEFEKKFSINLNNLPSGFESMKKAHLGFDTNLKYVEVRIGNFKLRDINGKMIYVAKHYFTLSKDLHRLLGFDPRKVSIVKELINELKEDYDKIASNPPINLDIDEYYVYSDIIKESFINNTKANILRIFPKNKKSEDEVVNYSFNHHLFLPLRVKEINSIKISIRNISADELYFDKGGINCTLLIRPIEYI